mgnify:CR=1 FL=1
MKLLKNSIVKRLIAVTVVYAVIMYFYMTYFALPLTNAAQHQLYETLTNQTYVEQQLPNLEQQLCLTISLIAFVISEIALLTVLSRRD